MKKSLIFLFILLISFKISAQVLDSSFGVNGEALTNLGFFNPAAYIRSSYIQPGGCILVGANEFDYEGYYQNTNIIAFTSSGILDSAFGNNGVAFLHANYGGYIASQSHNKIITAGTTVDFQGGSDNLVVIERLKSNGKPDSSFALNGILNLDFGNNSGTLGRQNINCLAVDSYDNIYAGGVIHTTNSGNHYFTIIKCKPNGSLDSSFQLRKLIRYENSCNSLNILADGSIIAGYIYDTLSYHSSCIIKYKPDGSRDATFGVNGVVLFANKGGSGSFLHTLVLNNGTILSATDDAGKIAFYKITSAGLRDKTFGTKGRLTTGEPFAATYDNIFSVDDKHRILLPLYPYKIKRFLANGDVDSSFGENGYVETTFIDPNPGDGAFELTLTRGNNFFGVGYYTDYNRSEFGVVKYKNSPETLVAGNSFASANKIIPTDVSNIKALISPNPVTNILHITNLSGKTNIAVTDVKGNVLIKAIVLQPGYDLNVSSLQSGIYYLMIQGSKQAINFFKE